MPAFVCLFVGASTGDPNQPREHPLLSSGMLSGTGNGQSGPYEQNTSLGAPSASRHRAPMEEAGGAGDRDANHKTLDR